jgi:hypothetical protein
LHIPFYNTPHHPQLPIAIAFPEQALQFTAPQASKGGCCNHCSGWFGQNRKHSRDFRNPVRMSFCPVWRRGNRCIPHGILAVDVSVILGEFEYSAQESFDMLQRSFLKRFAIPVLVCGRDLTQPRIDGSRLHVFQQGTADTLALSTMRVPHIRVPLGCSCPFVGLDKWLVHARDKLAQGNNELWFRWAGFPEVLHFR